MIDSGKSLMTSNDIAVRKITLPAKQSVLSVSRMAPSVSLECAPPHQILPWLQELNDIFLNQYAYLNLFSGMNAVQKPPFSVLVISLVQLVLAKV